MLLKHLHLLVILMDVSCKYVIIKIILLNNFSNCLKWLFGQAKKIEGIVWLHRERLY